ncbi:TldD/PmbA family protein, partial [candidate division WOR-3 bacterium]|nr:TldD/PmbA family protein [candidate division WOR-3 bacterium]MBD3363581.1 TldD/PmbA family protein [candidate division WOR-3 bacterium]
MISYFKEILTRIPADYVELRYHHRCTNAVAVRKGEPETAQSNCFEGVGIRIMDSGRWGFASTPGYDRGDILKATEDACTSARVMRKGKKTLAAAKLAAGEFRPSINDPLENHSFAEKLELVRKAEERARRHAKIASAVSSFVEHLDKKVIVTSDGAAALITDAKPEFRIGVVAKDGARMISVHEAYGATGGWKDLFRYGSWEDLCEKVLKRAERLLTAELPKGEKTTVILNPELVGLISHEAIGHTVEADFVQAGAVTKGMIGKRVGSDLVTLADTGPSVRIPGAAGTLLVDDEGVITERTEVIKEGILTSYLHNRETAAEFGVKPTGNARAYEYGDEPIIRMRNTYIEPGDMSLDELLDSTERAILLEGAGSGQADANAEFMFGVQEATLIEKGKRKKTFREATISGNAFEVLKSVDAVSKEFRWALGSGYCGKYQMAKVDAGGAYLRCKAIIG